MGLILFTHLCDLVCALLGEMNECIFIFMKIDCFLLCGKLVWLRLFFGSLNIGRMWVWKWAARSGLCQMLCMFSRLHINPFLLFFCLPGLEDYTLCLFKLPCQLAFLSCSANGRYWHESRRQEKGEPLFSSIFCQCFLECWWYYWQTQ